MARHRRRRQTALSRATGRSRRCASGCSGDTRWWCRCGAATARAAATSSATPTAPARARISVAPARARRWTCSPPSNGRRRSKAWMENDGCSSARAPAGSPRSTPPQNVPTGWSRCSRSRRVARAGRTRTRATPARRSAWPSCRVDRAADRRTGAVVLRRKRPVLRPAGAARVVRELQGGGRPRRARHDTAVSGGPRPRHLPRPDRHATLDRRSGELLPLAGPDAALLAQRSTHRATYCASLAPDPDPDPGPAPGPAPDPSPAPDPALASAAAGQPCCAPCLAVSLAALATSAPVAHAGLPLAVAAASDAGLLGLPVEEGPRLPLEAVSVRQLEHSDEAAVAGLNAG